MNYKNLPLALTIIAGFASNTTYSWPPNESFNVQSTNEPDRINFGPHHLDLSYNDVFPLTDEQTRRLIEEYGSTDPLDKTKTPTSPDIIEHQASMLKGRPRDFYRKRIYFGKENSGDNCYRSINEHSANNPDFGSVELVIFKERSLFKLRLNNTFETIGTFAHKDLHSPLIKSIAAAGGVWCPEQNAIIGGTKEKSICEQFAEFKKEINQTKWLKK